MRSLKSQIGIIFGILTLVLSVVTLGFIIGNSNNTQVSAKQGPKGIKGPKGDRGPRGPRGRQGDSVYLHFARNFIPKIDITRFKNTAAYKKAFQDYEAWKGKNPAAAATAVFEKHSIYIKALIDWQTWQLNRAYHRFYKGPKGDPGQNADPSTIKAAFFAWYDNLAQKLAKQWIADTQLVKVASKAAWATKLGTTLKDLRRFLTISSRWKMRKTPQNKFVLLDQTALEQPQYQALKAELKKLRPVTWEE